MKISEADKKIFLEFFRGREDYFAFQGPDFYSPINKNISEYYLERHLNGLATFGIYVLTKDSNCNFFCLDIDIPKEKLYSLDFKGPKIKFDYLKEKLFKLKSILENELKISEDTILFEDTGGRGYHIWLFFEEPIKGEDAVKLNKIIRNFTEFDFEFFPKQPSLNKKLKFGNLIKLPLGIHQSYNTKSNFFKIANSIIVFPSSWKENFEYLHNLKRISRDKVNQLLNEHKEIFKDDKIDKFSEENIPDIERIYYRSELDFLFQKCSALNNLKIKAEEGIALYYSEMFHFTNILLSVKISEEFLFNKIQQSYGPKFSFDYTKNEIEKIKVLHPTSCNKLIEQGICKGYCNESIKENNLDPLQSNTNPLSFWLTPIRSVLSIKDTDLIDKISDLENIKNAFWKLKKYHKTEDALFYDEFDFEQFEKDLDIHSRYISSFFMNKEKFPLVGFLKFKIPKKVNEDYEIQYRQLSYSNVFEQVIIQSIFNIISIVFEANFQASSYGYRFNTEEFMSEDIFCDWREFYPQFRNKVLEQNRKHDIKYRISCDIKGYYDNIKHEILLQQIKGYIIDDYILKTLEKIIDLYRYEEGKKQGLPQGPAYARILANLYLNDFDKEITKHTSGYFRYVDDLFLFFKNRTQAEKGLAKIVEILQYLGLQLSEDEKKKPKIIETSNEEALVETLDSLRYGIFEEFKFIDYMDIEEVYNFYTAIEKHQVSISNVSEILEINNKLPSIIYLISKDFDFSLPISKKIPAIIKYLIENQLFYPKRLKYIFYEIIHLMEEEEYDITELYKQLNDSHKIYFFLSLYGIYKQQAKYEEELKNIAIKSLESNDYFLKGFAIKISKELGLQNSFLNANFLNDVLSCDSHFPLLKLFDSINFFELTSELRSIFRDKLSYQSSYLERKHFLSNLSYENAEYIDNIFLLNLMKSDGYMLLAECSKLFSTIKDQNILFSRLESFIVSYAKYKNISINYLKSLIFNLHKNSGKSVIDNLISLYNKIEDNEVNRELTKVLNRIKDVIIPSEEQFYKNHDIIEKYNECFFYKNIDKENAAYQYVEVIPYDKLKSFQINDLRTLEISLKDLSFNKILPVTNFKYDSTSNEVIIKYFIPESFEEINVASYSMNGKDILSLFEIAINIYKKSEYFYKIFNIVPFINNKNLFINKLRNEVMFKNFGSILCSNYTINSNVIRSDDPKEIPQMLSFLLQYILFQNDEEKFQQFIKSSKIGIKLFLSHFITRMSSKDPSIRYSYSRFNYLIEQIKEKDVQSECKTTLLFFNERLKTNLFVKNQYDIQWINICNSLEKFYGDLAIIYDSVNFNDIDYHNKIFMNFNLPRHLHHLSTLLLNISLNIQNNLKKSSVNCFNFNLFDLLNYYAIFCIEIITLFKVGIKSSPKITHHIPLGDKITLKMHDYSLNLYKNDIKLINVLLARDSIGQDIFDPSLQFSLKQILFLFLSKVFKLTINGNTLTINNADMLNEKNFDIIAHNLIVKLPNIEIKIRNCVQKILNDLKSNQDSELSDEEINLIDDILLACKEINIIRKKLGYNRCYGKNIRTKRWPPKIYCRSGLFKIFKTENHALFMIPFVNRYPSTSIRCSWDFSSKEVINAVIPNERIKKLTLKLSKGKIFGYRLKYLYSEKAKFLCDIFFIFLFALFAITSNNIFNQISYGWLKSILWFLQYVFSLVAFFFFGKSLIDARHWSKNFYRMIKYIKS